MQFLLGSQENMQIASTSSQKHEIKQTDLRGPYSIDFLSFSTWNNKPDTCTCSQIHNSSSHI